MEDGYDALNKAIKKKRTISWTINLNDIHEIPITKLMLKDDVIEEIKGMFLCIKRFMLKRNQLCKLSELIQIYERNSEKG